MNTSKKLQLDCIKIGSIMQDIYKDNDSEYLDIYCIWENVVKSIERYSLIRMNNVQRYTLQICIVGLCLNKPLCIINGIISDLGYPLMHQKVLSDIMNHVHLNQDQQYIRKNWDASKLTRINADRLLHYIDELTNIDSCIKTHMKKEIEKYTNQSIKTIHIKSKKKKIIKDIYTIIRPNIRITIQKVSELLCI